MKKTNRKTILCMLLVACLIIVGCGTPKPQKSDSGIDKASVTVTAGSDGLTTEQRNISKKIELDNTEGTIRHLYIVSSYSGEPIFYSTVTGKVTSSGKRLSPRTVNHIYTLGDSEQCSAGIPMKLGDKVVCTEEVIEDDGTFGDSMQYLYWFDVNGQYRQLYITGGQIVIIADNPIPEFNKVVVRFKEVSK